MRSVLQVVELSNQHSFKFPFPVCLCASQGHRFPAGLTSATGSWRQSTLRCEYGLGGWMGISGSNRVPQGEEMVVLCSQGIGAWSTHHTSPCHKGTSRVSDRTKPVLLCRACSCLVR